MHWLPRAYDLITSPAYFVIKAGEEFQNRTTASNQMWQTEFAATRGPSVYLSQGCRLGLAPSLDHSR